MKTNLDISRKSFSKKMFGYDESEVAAYLEKLSLQFEEIIHDRNVLKEQLRQKDLILADFRDREANLNNTITTANNMVNRIREDAEREARLIIADALQKSEIIVKEARESLKKQYQEMSDLKRARLQFEANLKALALSHIALLEQGEKVMPTFGMNHVDFSMAKSSPDATPLAAATASEEEVPPYTSPAMTAIKATVTQTEINSPKSVIPFAPEI